MILKKSNFVLFLILAFVAGYGVSCLFGGGGVEQNKAGGDVSKASRYSKVRDDAQLKLLQEKLQNDDEYFKQTKEFSAFLLDRVNSLVELTERSIDQCAGIEEFKDQVAGLRSLNAKAGNTELALEEVSSGLDRMAEGKDVPGYEQAYNNAIAGFFRIEKQLGLGKSFVESAGRYMEGNENAELAALTSEWAAYCYQDASLNDSEVEMAYWNDKYNDLAGNAAGTVGLNPELLSGLNVLIDDMDRLTPKSLMDMLQILHLDNSDLPGIKPPQPHPIRHDTLIY